MKKRELELTITISKEDGELYISTENGSGARYPFNHLDDIGENINEYLELYCEDFFN